jgi:hypothetical protein
LADRDIGTCRLAALRRDGPPPYRMNPTALYGSVILSSGGMAKRPARRSGRLPRPFAYR